MVVYSRPRTICVGYAKQYGRVASQGEHLGFLGPLCHEYKIKRIIASYEECIEEATFKALLEAVGASLVDA
jgi:hypothetical protein